MIPFLIRKNCSFFEPYTQQDVHECLSCMLNILNDVNHLLKDFDLDALTNPKKKKTFKLFGGTNTDVQLVPNNITSDENLDPEVNQTRLSNLKAPAFYGYKGIKKNKFSVIKLKTIDGPVKSVNYKKFNTSHQREPFSNYNEKEKLITSPTGGCYQRFKRKRFGNNSEIYKLSTDVRNANKNENFHSVSSPPPKKQRTSLILHNNLDLTPQNHKTSNCFKTTKKLNIKRTKLSTKFFSKLRCDNNTKSALTQSETTEGTSSITSKTVNIKPIANNPKIPDNLFRGETTTVSKCLECENSKDRIEPFMVSFTF